MARPRNSRSKAELQQAEKLISIMGGIQKTADYCGISSPSVSQWKQNGVPWPWKMFFRSQSPKNKYKFLKIKNAKRKRYFRT